MKRRVDRRAASATGGCGLVVLVGMMISSAVARADQFVAGVDSSQRPPSAPVISAPQKGADWQATALRGVSDPKPASLKFLNDQGAWYTPFNHPGMPGFYDIRGLHGAKR